MRPRQKTFVVEVKKSRGMRKKPLLKPSGPSPAAAPKSLDRPPDREDRPRW